MTGVGPQLAGGSGVAGGGLARGGSGVAAAGGGSPEFISNAEGTAANTVVTVAIPTFEPGDFAVAMVLDRNTTGDGIWEELDGWDQGDTQFLSSRRWGLYSRVLEAGDVSAAFEFQFSGNKVGQISVFRNVSSIVLAQFNLGGFATTVKATDLAAATLSGAAMAYAVAGLVVQQTLTLHASLHQDYTPIEHTAMGSVGNSQSVTIFSAYKLLEDAAAGQTGPTFSTGFNNNGAYQVFLA